MQGRRDLPENRDWLSRAELDVLSGLRFAPRRADWLLGRWVGKRLIAGLMRRTPDAEIEILSRSDGSPTVRVQGGEVGYRLSLSHRTDLALAVAATGEVGCDLELVEPRSRGFVEDYFDERERALIEGADPDHTPALVNSLWSAKESTLKLLRKGLTMDTRLVSIEPSESTVSETWKPFRVTVSTEPRAMTGWWRARGRHLLTVVTDPASSMPRHLDSVPVEEG